MGGTRSPVFPKDDVGIRIFDLIVLVILVKIKETIENRTFKTPGKFEIQSNYPIKKSLLLNQNLNHGFSYYKSFIKRSKYS